MLLDASLPQLMPDTFSVQQNDSIQTFQVLDNDVFGEDYSGSRCIRSVSSGSQGGWVGIGPDGSDVRYASAPGFVGEESFRYYVDDIGWAEVSVGVQSPLAADMFGIVSDGKVSSLDVPVNDAVSVRSALTLMSVSDSGVLGTLSMLSDSQGEVFVQPTMRDDWRFMEQYDGTISIDVLANDFMGSGYTGPKQITSIGETSDGGIAVLSDDGSSILYTPPEGFIGCDGFEYVVDGQYKAWGVVVVESVVRDDWRFMEQYDGTISIDVLANDFRGDGYTGPKQITSITETNAGGIAVLSDDGRSILYTPPEGFIGCDGFQYVVDGRHKAWGVVVVEPAVISDWRETVQDDTISIDVLANDFEDDGYTGSKQITSITETKASGIAVLSDDGRSILYTPPEGFIGSDSFGYVVDGRDEGLVVVVVHQAVKDDSRDMVQDDTISIDVLANDFGANIYVGPKQITSISETEAGGSVILSDDGCSILYTSPDGFVGQDSFTYAVDDKFTASVTVEVTPRARSDTYSFLAQPVSTDHDLDVLSNDALSVSYAYAGLGLITSVDQPQQGAVTIVDGGRQLRLTVPAGFDGDLQFSYTVDGRYNGSVTVSVPSRLKEDEIHVLQDSHDVVLDVLQNDLLSPDDGYLGPGLISAVGIPEMGTARISEDGRSILYTPAQDFVGTDRFTYSVDGMREATVTVSVNDDNWVGGWNCYDRSLMIDITFTLHPIDTISLVEIVNADPSTGETPADTPAEEPSLTSRPPAPAPAEILDQPLLVLPVSWEAAVPYSGQDTNPPVLLSGNELPLRLTDFDTAFWTSESQDIPSESSEFAIWRDWELSDSRGLRGDRLDGEIPFGVEGSGSLDISETVTAPKDAANADTTSAATLLRRRSVKKTPRFSARDSVDSDTVSLAIIHTAMETGYEFAARDRGESAAQPSSQHDEATTPGTATQIIAQSDTPSELATDPPYFVAEAQLADAAADEGVAAIAALLAAVWGAPVLTEANDRATIPAVRRSVRRPPPAA